MSYIIIWYLLIWISLKLHRRFIGSCYWNSITFSCYILRTDGFVSFDISYSYIQKFGRIIDNKYIVIKRYSSIIILSGVNTGLTVPLYILNSFIFS